MNIRLEVNERIATIIFDRPKAYNALNTETLQEIDEVVKNLKDNSLVDVIVFTGEGKSFIAGADISEMAVMDEEQAKIYGQFGSNIFRKIEQIEKPTIAAINGYCLGGGNELALSCDIRIASIKAKFGQPEVSLGITPGFSGTQRLPRIIGIAKAKELLFTGRVIDANEALNIGLVNFVVEEEEFLEKVYEFAKQIIKNSQYAVRSVKKAINEGIEKSIDEAIEIESNYFSECFKTYDQKEGMKAFIEKRQADFRKDEV